MRLQTRMLLAGGLGRYSGTAVLLILGTWYSPILYLLSLAWLIGCRPCLRYGLLPFLFPATTCPAASCRRRVSLSAVWKCGGHYIDHRSRHVSAFHCNRGHELRSFACPYCKATIQVQKGTKATLHHGEQVEAAHCSPTLSAPRSRRAEPGILLGYNRHVPAKGVPRILRKILRLPSASPVYLHPETHARHQYILGGTGMGKSTAIINEARQLFRRGEGATFLDPSGDLARDLLKQVPWWRADDVLYIDVANAEFPFPFNLLSTTDDTERNNLPDELMGAIQRLSDGWGSTLERVIRMAVNTVLSFEGSLRDLYDLLSSASARHRLLPRIDDAELKEYWRDAYPSLRKETRHSAVNKLTKIVEHHRLGPILCASDCAFRADDIIRDRKIVIVNLHIGSPSDRVPTILGTFVVNKIIAAAYRQGALAHRDRVQHFLFVDEFQNFMHKAQEFDRILSEARKYRLVFIGANQFISQLQEKARDAIFGNVGCLMIFRIGQRDAALLKDEFFGTAKRDLMELTLGSCFVRFSTPTSTQSLALTTPPPPPEPRGFEEIVAALPARYRDRAASIAELIALTKQDTALAALIDDLDVTDYVQERMKAAGKTEPRAETADEGTEEPIDEAKRDFERVVLCEFV